ncbi:MAG: hypothetical protein LBR61_13640 [Synergistaceae bacterium]|jgi:vacuolar-type H+-ATPase subunit F/Vma7|nr:hypothetical protein [Synergistaceae bacterium]
MTEEGQVPAVVGRQIFVDLWSLLGFASLVCETPAEFPAVSGKLEALDPALVVAEKRWFDGLHDSLKRRLKDSRSPVWLTLPDAADETEEK